MKRILVPFDFSAPSMEAAKVALRIAAITQGEVTLVHVILIPVEFNPTFVEGLESESIKKFDSLKSKLDLNGIRLRFKVVYGDIVLSTKAIIEIEKIDLVVMGTKGDSGLHEILIGSNTEKIVRHAAVPVLAVRTAFELSGVKRILVPTALALNQTEFMNYVKGLQKLFQATLDILYVNTPTKFKNYDQSMREMKEFIAHYKLENCETNLRDYNTEEEGIIEFAEQEKTDLLVMATHARKGLAHLFNGSVTEKIVNRLDYPVWTYSLGK
jgi:nucleotide-binding universal stress UspA family protein